MKFKLLILIVVHLLCCCSSTKYGFSKSDLEKNYEFVEYIIRNIDSLDKIFRDTSKVSSYISNSIIGIEMESKFLKNYINENKFYDGYDFVDENIYYMGLNSQTYNYKEENTVKIFTHGIKIKSKYNGNILWLLFRYSEKKGWKYNASEECNNYLERVQELKDVIPCDKK